MDKQKCHLAFQHFRNGPSFGYIVGSRNHNKKKPDYIAKNYKVDTVRTLSINAAFENEQ